MAVKTKGTGSAQPSGSHWTYLIEDLVSRGRTSDARTIEQYLYYYKLKHEPGSKDHTRYYVEKSYQKESEAAARILHLDPDQLDQYHFHIEPENTWYYYVRIFADPKNFKHLRLIHDYLRLKQELEADHLDTEKDVNASDRARIHDQLQNTKKLLADAFSIKFKFIDYIDHRIDPDSPEALLAAHLANKGLYDSIMDLKAFDYHRIRYEQAVENGEEYPDYEIYEALRKKIIETYGARTDFQDFLQHDELPETSEVERRNRSDFRQRVENLKAYLDTKIKDPNERTKALQNAVEALSRRSKEAGSFSGKLEDILTGVLGDIKPVIESKMPGFSDTTFQELAEELVGKFKDFASHSISQTEALYDSAAEHGQSILNRPDKEISKKYDRSIRNALGSIREFIDNPNGRNRLSINDVMHFVNNHRRAISFAGSSADLIQTSEALVSGLIIEMREFEKYLYDIDKIHQLTDPEYLLKVFEVKLSYLNAKFSHLDFSSDDISFYAAVLADLSSVSRGYGNSSIDDRTKQYYHNTGDHSFTTIVTLMSLANSTSKEIEKAREKGKISETEYEQECNELKANVRFLTKMAIFHDLGEHFRELLGPNLKDETAAVESVLRRIRDIVEGTIAEDYALEHIRETFQKYNPDFQDEDGRKKVNDFVKRAKKVLTHTSDIEGEESLFDDPYYMALFDALERINTQTQLHALHDAGKIGKDGKWSHGGHIPEPQLRYAAGYFSRIFFGEPFRLISQDEVVIHQHAAAVREAESERVSARETSATAGKTGVSRSRNNGTLEGRPYTDRPYLDEIQERAVDFHTSIFKKLYDYKLSLLVQVANNTISFEQASSRMRIQERLLEQFLEEGIHKVTKGFRIHPDYKEEARKLEVAFRSKAAQGVALLRKKLERDGFTDLVDRLIRKHMEENESLKNLDYEIKDSMYTVLKNIVHEVLIKEITDEAEINKIFKKRRETKKLKEHDLFDEAFKICRQIIKDKKKLTESAPIDEIFKLEHLCQAPWIFGKIRRLIGFRSLGGVLYNSEEPGRYIAPIQPLLRVLNVLGKQAKEGISYTFKLTATPFNLMAYSLAKSLSPSDTANILRKIGVAESGLDTGITLQSGFSFSELKITAMFMPLLSWSIHFRKKHREAIEKCYGHILLKFPEEIAEKYAPGFEDVIKMLMRSSSKLAKTEEYVGNDADIFPSGAVSKIYYEQYAERYSIQRRINEITRELALRRVTDPETQLSKELHDLRYRQRQIELNKNAGAFYSVALLDTEERYYLKQLIRDAKKKLKDRSDTTFGEGKKEQRSQQWQRLDELDKLIKVNPIGQFIRENPLALRFAALAAIGTAFVLSTSVGFAIPFTGINILGTSLMASGMIGLLMVAGSKLKDLPKSNMIVRFIEDIPSLEQYKPGNSENFSYYSQAGHTARLGASGRYGQSYEAFLDTQLDGYQNMSQTRGNMNLGLFLAALVKTGIMRIANADGLKNAFNAQLVAGTLDAAAALATGIFLYHTLAISPALVIAGGIMAFSYGLVVSVGNKILGKAMEMQAKGETPTHYNLVRETTDSFRYDESNRELFAFLLNTGNALKNTRYLGTPLTHVWRIVSAQAAWGVTSRAEDFATIIPGALRDLREKLRPQTPSPT